MPGGRGHPARGRAGDGARAGRLRGGGAPVRPGVERRGPAPRRAAGRRERRGGGRQPAARCRRASRVRAVAARRHRAARSRAARADERAAGRARRDGGRPPARDPHPPRLDDGLPRPAARAAPGDGGAARAARRGPRGDRAAGAIPRGLPGLRRPAAAATRARGAAGVGGRVGRRSAPRERRHSCRGRGRDRFFVDRRLLEHGLRNLLQNAVDALGTQPGTIDIAGSIAEGRVELRIADDGPGIPRRRWRRSWIRCSPRSRRGSDSVSASCSAWWSATAARSRSCPRPAAARRSRCACRWGKCRWR